MMTRKLIFLFSLLLFGSFCFAQDTKKEVDAAKTKMDAFASKTGSMIRFIDTKLPNIKSSYGGATTRIRKISSGSVSAYFFQIVKGGTYGSNTASIEYSDLVEIIKALKSLKAELLNDVSMKPDYLENKFVTEDGFEVGYYVNGEKATWYIKLEKYGSDNTIFIKEGDDIEVPFNEARNKIEELKNAEKI